MKAPQALKTTYPQRLSTFSTALIAPMGVMPPTNTNTSQNTPGERSSARNRRSTMVNYAEVDDGDELVEDHTNDPRASVYGNGGPVFAVGGVPVVNGNGVAAEAMIKKPVHIVGKLATSRTESIIVERTEKQLVNASSLPEILIPIRLDLDLDPPRGRLHDIFLWNLNECLITPDAFAITMCLDLDLPLTPYASTISSTIRDQISEYAPVATIPLPSSTASSFSSFSSGGGADPGESPGEMRIVCPINITVGERVYADKFEWDLTSPLTPERFAKIIAADLGLSGEFIPAITNGIYETTLLKKKDLYETGGTAELQVDAHRTGSEAGWRLDLESLCMEWEPRVEKLSRDEIEKREVDRDREVRRLRRETARFGNNSSAWSTPYPYSYPYSSSAAAVAAGAGGEIPEEQMGRGSRVKRKRQRSLTPNRGTPSRSTPQQQQQQQQQNGVIAGGSGVGGGGGSGGMTEWEKTQWKCGCCLVLGTGTWAIRDGPKGARTLCHVCNSIWVRTGMIPEWAVGLHAVDVNVTTV